MKNSVILNRPTSISMGGLLNINKSPQNTSFEVVRVVKRILNEKRVGHCGTLDPMATGVLLVLFGRATTLSNRLMAGKKSYLGEMTLGIQTDTGDMTGKIIQKSGVVPEINLSQIETAFEKFIGEIIQIPPKYSAVKREGRKLYEYARQGIDVIQPPRIISIYSAEIIRYAHPKITFRLICSSGTYVRSWVEDVGNELGYPATLSSLVREQVGSYRVEDSLDFNDLLKINREQLLSASIPYSEIAHEM